MACIAINEPVLQAATAALQVRRYQFCEVRKYKWHGILSQTQMDGRSEHNSAWVGNMNIEVRGWEKVIDN